MSEGKELALTAAGIECLRGFIYSALSSAFQSIKICHFLIEKPSVYEIW